MLALVSRVIDLIGNGLEPWGPKPQWPDDMPISAQEHDNVQLNDGTIFEMKHIIRHTYGDDLCTFGVVNMLSSTPRLVTYRNGHACLIAEFFSEETDEANQAHWQITCPHTKRRTAIIWYAPSVQKQQAIRGLLQTH